jgi:hypothetical protein
VHRVHSPLYCNLLDLNILAEELTRQLEELEEQAEELDKKRQEGHQSSPL